MHLGFLLNFREGSLQVAPAKLKSVRKELGKFLTNSEISCRKTAAILGTVRSFLLGLPFFKAFKDTMVDFVNQQKNLGLGF